MANHRMGITEWGFLLALAVLWSWVFFLTKLALGDMQPFTVVVLPARHRRDHSAYRGAVRRFAHAGLAADLGGVPGHGRT